MEDADVEPVLISVSQAARMLSVSERVMYDLANSGRLRKRYLEGSARNFRLEADQVREFALGLPTETTRQ